jgi:hypothetical protein
MFEKVVDYSLRDFYRYLYKRVLIQEPLTGFSSAYPCVFTLSTGRVGTQTVAALYALASNAFAYHEPSPKLYGLSKLSYHYAGSLDTRISVLFQEAFAVARNKQLNDSLSCCKGYIETSPQCTFLAPTIAELVANVRFIHLVRDPRDVVTSGMRRQWYAGHPADETRIVPREDLTMGAPWQSLSPFQKNLWLWTETNEWILNFLSSLPESRWLLVHSEDVFNADKVTLEKLFDFVGSSLPAMSRINRVLSKKYNAQKTGTFMKPTTWADDMYAELERIAGATARAFGYDL